MKTENKISIIMGIYNCHDTLNEAVNCIINQTYSNWELIMCDDGSTDNTYDLAMKLSNKDNRIKVIKNDHNIGLAPTLNHCLQYANGEFIARMDGDDICALDRLEKEFNFLKKNPSYSFVSCNMNCYDGEGIFRKVYYKKTPQLIDFINNSQFCHAGSLIRKDALIAVDGYNLNSAVERVEDYDLWLRLYEKGYKGYNIQEFLYSMRDDRNAIRRRKFKYRINEVKIKKRAFDLSECKKIYLYKVFIPILKGFIPTFIYRVIHRNL